MSLSLFSAKNAFELGHAAHRQHCLKTVRELNEQIRRDVRLRHIEQCKNDGKQKISFFELPREIRDQCYKQLALSNADKAHHLLPLPPSQPPHWRSLQRALPGQHDCPVPSECDQYCDKHGHGLQALRVNHQFRDELMEQLRKPHQVQILINEDGIYQLVRACTVDMAKNDGLLVIIQTSPAIQSFRCTSVIAPPFKISTYDGAGNFDGLVPDPEPRTDGPDLENSPDSLDLVNDGAHYPALGWNHNFWMLREHVYSLVNSLNNSDFLGKHFDGKLTIRIEHVATFFYCMFSPMENQEYWEALLQAFKACRLKIKPDIKLWPVLNDVLVSGGYSVSYHSPVTTDLNDSRVHQSEGEYGKWLAYYRDARIESARRNDCFSFIHSEPTHKVDAWFTGTVDFQYWRPLLKLVGPLRDTMYDQALSRPIIILDKYKIPMDRTPILEAVRIVGDLVSSAPVEYKREAARMLEQAIFAESDWEKNPPFYGMHSAYDVYLWIELLKEHVEKGGRWQEMPKFERGLLRSW